MVSVSVAHLDNFLLICKESLFSSCFLWIQFFSNQQDSFKEKPLKTSQFLLEACCFLQRISFIPLGGKIGKDNQEKEGGGFTRSYMSFFFENILFLTSPEFFALSLYVKLRYKNGFKMLEIQMEDLEQSKGTAFFWKQKKLRKFFKCILSTKISSICNKKERFRLEN